MESMILHIQIVCLFVCLFGSFRPTREFFIKKKLKKKKKKEKKRYAYFLLIWHRWYLWTESVRNSDACTPSHDAFKFSFINVSPRSDITSGPSQNMYVIVNGLAPRTSRTVI